MQSVGGVNLECADCKANFSSASLLLKHFGEHITGRHTGNESSSSSKISASSNESGSYLLQEKKKEENESILEGVLKQCSVHNLHNVKLPLFQNYPGAISTSLCASPTSESQNSSSSSTDNIQSQEEKNYTLHHTMVLEIGERAKEKQKFSGNMTLIKLDLQKRLENCVSKLSSKHDNGVNVSLMKHSPVIHCTTTKTDAQKTVSNELLPSKFIVNKHIDTEDFNPLKFCMVTLEEEKLNENVKSEGEKNVILKRFRGASSRKQLTPKKIHRPLENIEIFETPCMVSLSSFDNKETDRQTVHKQKRKYLCHICTKSFGWSTDLKRHILTHTGERPFKCQICEATFTRNFLLQKHESRVHNLVAVNNSCSQDDECNVIRSKSSKMQTETDNTMNIRKSQPVVLC